jgi:hypothetical protein
MSVALALAGGGCGRNEAATTEGESRVTIAIVWQRLVTDAGETCERCEITGDEFRRAVATLRESLAPLGIDVEASEQTLSPDEFAASTIESNRILIGGRSLEEWLEAETGESECESCCDAVGEDVKCRTVSLEGLTYEAIPAELIVRAGLLAASHLLESTETASCCPGVGRVDGDRGASCCPGGDGADGDRGASCCPGEGGVKEAVGKPGEGIE